MQIPPLQFLVLCSMLQLPSAFWWRADPIKGRSDCTFGILSTAAGDGLTLPGTTAAEARTIATFASGFTKTAAAIKSAAASSFGTKAADINILAKQPEITVALRLRTAAAFLELRRIIVELGFLGHRIVFGHQQRIRIELRCLKLRVAQFKTLDLRFSRLSFSVAVNAGPLSLGFSTIELPMVNANKRNAAVCTTVLISIGGGVMDRQLLIAATIPLSFRLFFDVCFLPKRQWEAMV